ncbi:MAG TPA: hypothetical protein VEU52_01570 [Candidatus Limnocylindrales bacterium]|nr:hypothetical protein [Candidatus Limnocylindrales bacterium]
MRRGISFLAAAILCATLAARADELKLKDGTKITGTIVGFEDNSFKVKTSFGFALVQRDQVVSISISSEAGKKPEPAAEKPAETPKPSKTETASKPAPAPSVATESKPASANAAPKPAKSEATAATASPATPAVNAKTTSPAPTSAPAAATGAATPAPASSSAASSTAPATNATSAAPAAPAAKPAPPKPPAPEPVREDVNGNTYTNDTYGFRMYKPPSWRMIEGARTILPGAITAMGPADESTYLLIGLAPAGETLTDDIDEAEQRLREVMTNFRIIEQKRLMVSGISSIAHRFRGSVDQREWSGIVVFVPYGTRIYTVFGMTLAQSDLVQIQENVLTRAIASLQFSRQ